MIYYLFQKSHHKKGSSQKAYFQNISISIQLIFQPNLDSKEINLPGLKYLKSQIIFCSTNITLEK